MRDGTKGSDSQHRDCRGGRPKGSDISHRHRRGGLNTTGDAGFPP
jgi:hypothetical protein